MAAFSHVELTSVPITVNQSLPGYHSAALLPLAGLEWWGGARPAWTGQGVLGTLYLAVSSAGRTLALSLPVTLLIGAQTYRIVVELFIHQFWSAGLLPRMLTYDGANFDIVVGRSRIARISVCKATPDFKGLLI